MGSTDQRSTFGRSGSLSQSLPIASRKPKDVLAAVSLMYFRLRSLRIPVLRVHTDRAKEFVGKDFKAWCMARDLWRTTTSGSEPQVNSRAEMEIGAVRNLARTMLKAIAVLPTTTGL